MVTEEEKRLLELPSSQIVIDISKKLEPEPPEKWWIKILRSKKYIFGLSALIAAILPIYEINARAITYFKTKAEVDQLLVNAGSLMSIDANDKAQQVLDRVKTLDSSNLKASQLQAIVDLEETLREKQDKKSLQILEVIYKDILPTSPKATYLLGTAYIGVNLEKAEQMLELADSKREANNVILLSQINSGRIWIKARKFDTDRDLQHLEESEKLYNDTLQELERADVNVDSVAVIGLHHQFAMICNKRGSIGGELWRNKAIDISLRAFSIAQKSGNHKLIGKTSAGLAEKYKDVGKSELARTYARYAIQNAELAKDERGFYFNLYTLGQVLFQIGDTQEALKCYNESFLLATKHTDLRMQIYNSVNKSKCLIILKRHKEARSELERVTNYSLIANDSYGRFEGGFLSILNDLSRGKEKPKIQMQLENLIPLAREVGELKTVEFWNEILTNEKSLLPISNESFLYEKEIEIPVYNRTMGINL